MVLTLEVTNELLHYKPNNLGFALSKDSAKPGHLTSLIRLQFVLN